MYITLAQLKQYQGIPLDDTDSDALLTQFIVNAQKMVDNHCHRKFEAATNTTRYFQEARAIRGNELWLDRDLAAINTVTNGDGTVVAANQYRVIPPNAISDGIPIEAIKLKPSAGINWDLGDEDGIAISGKWAYSVSAPDDVVQAMWRLAGYFFGQKDNASDIDKPILISAEGNTSILPRQLPKDLKVLLAPYVRAGVTS